MRWLKTSYGRPVGVRTSIIPWVTLVVVASLHLAVDCRAQTDALPFLAGSTDAQAYVLVLGSPPGMQGFNVYRKGAGESEFRLITPNPVVAVADPARAHALLADDFGWIARALRLQDPFEVLSRFRTDPGAAIAISLASPRAAAVAGRLFVDETVEEGRTYEYRIDMLDLDANVLASASRSLRIADQHPEPAPSGVVAEAGDGNVRIQWDYPEYAGNPNDVVVGFHVYRQEQDGSYERLQHQPVLRQDELTYRIDGDVHNNEDYSYYVTAVDFIGRESEPSAVVSGRPQDLTPPLFPREVEVFPEEDAILVTWQMNLELDLSHYDVFRSFDLEDGYRKINAEAIPGEQISFLDENVHSGPLYHYKVRAVDLVGNESELSNAATGRPLDETGPARPDSLTATLDGHTVHLSWMAPDDVDLEGYIVYRKRDEEQFLPVTPRPLHKDTLQIVDSGYTGRGLWPGKTYVYGVAAIDHAFNESEYAIIEMAIPDDEPPPPPVESHARSNAEGSVDVQWQPSHALDVVAYRVYRTLEGDSATAWMTFDETTFEATDSTAQRGRPHAYFVVAVDAAGNESDGTQPTVVTPRDLQAPPPPIGVQATVLPDGVALSWQAVQASDLVGYLVYRSDSPYGTTVQLTRSPISETSFRDPEGLPGQYYRVTSLDTSGHENKGGELAEARVETSSF